MCIRDRGPAYVICERWVLMLRRAVALHPPMRDALTAMLVAYERWGGDVGCPAPAWGPARLALAALPAGSGLSTQPDGQPRRITPSALPQPLLRGPIQALRR
eukprot:775095-Alexandrium_andersonii.AAC.1